MLTQLFLSLFIIYNITFIYNKVYVKCGELQLERFVPLTPDKSYADNFVGRVTKFNRSTYILNTEVDTYKEFDNTFNVRFDLYSKHGNEYRKLFTKLGYGACKFASQDQFFYQELINASNLPPKDTCPVKPNHYKVSQFQLNVDKLPSIIKTAEDWKMYAAIEKQERAVVAAEIYFKFTKY